MTSEIDDDPMDDIGADGEINEYDSNGRLIHYKKYGYECWREYDSNGKLIHYKNSNGYEEWYKHNSNGEHNSNGKDSKGDMTRRESHP